MSFAKTLSRDEMKNVMAGNEQCNKCCWVDDVIDGDYSNCSGGTQGPSGDCQAGAIKVACWYY